MQCVRLTGLREAYVAMVCTRGVPDHVRYLVRLAELELIDRERRTAHWATGHRCRRPSSRKGLIRSSFNGDYDQIRPSLDTESNLKSGIVRGGRSQRLGSFRSFLRWKVGGCIPWTFIYGFGWHAMLKG